MVGDHGDSALCNDVVVFVSTGWLAYFDSWYVLGLLVATFSGSRSSPRPQPACCAPWIDERFVLALPLVVLIRGVSAGTLDGGRQRTISV